MKKTALVIGAGHAGCEAALALARCGIETVCITLSIDAIAYMACNPSIGGTSKGHIVREIDALGGEMGRAIDDVFLQSRMINTKKGPAVHSLRAQADKEQYQRRMRRALFAQPGLSIRQGEVRTLLVEDGVVRGVITTHGETYWADAIVLCSGVYQNSRLLCGDAVAHTGPAGHPRSTYLSDELAALGFSLMRFKTGTPPRVTFGSLDISQMIVQPGDEPIEPFSFLSDAAALSRPQIPCYLTYTNETTHEILRANLSRSPMYSGKISGMGARYCPSIEDKIVRFADKARHQIFFEPESADGEEWYVQGFSTSMPWDVQQEALQTVAGCAQAHIVRYGYAIEYDCIDARDLSRSLMAKNVNGLFFAGQICGSSGYEEAAAQGLMAGINAARYLQGEAPVILGRDQAYIGVLIDDLTTIGTPEPYRMMTSRAEYRLLLRQDNADERLTEIGYAAGLGSEERLQRMQTVVEQKRTWIERIEKQVLSAAQSQSLLEAYDVSFAPGTPVRAVVCSGRLQAAQLATIWQDETVDLSVLSRAMVEVRYAGYIQRQQREVEYFQKTAHRRIPPSIDYQAIEGLRIEAREKLMRVRPEDFGQAGRISGVNPGDMAVLNIYLRRLEQQEKESE